MAKDAIEKALQELRDGMALPKCRRCGCMEGGLTALASVPPGPEPGVGEAWHEEAATWQSRMEPKRYECLGCEKCYAADAIKALRPVLPEAAASDPACALGPERPGWPPIPGEYYALCGGNGCSVAVSTLACPELAKALAEAAPAELCITGKTETENIGIEKIIKNTITNRSIRHLILAGREPKGHLAGGSLLCLAESGVDEGMRIIGSPSPRPVLRNVSRAEVEAFRAQVQVVDMIGCEETSEIAEKVKEVGRLVSESKPSCACTSCAEVPASPHENLPVIRAQEPANLVLDKAGYFVILPLCSPKLLRAEHYDYQNRLLHVVEGQTARSLYCTMIQNGWVTELMHAAYLGKELARAERALNAGSSFVQDGATARQV